MRCSGNLISFGKTRFVLLSQVRACSACPSTEERRVEGQAWHGLTRNAVPKSFIFVLLGIPPTLICVWLFREIPKSQGSWAVWQFAFETDRKEQGLAPYVTRPLKVKEDLKANRSPLRMEEWRNGYWVFVQMFFRMFVNYSLFGIIFHCCTGEQCVVFARYFIASEYNCDAGATQALRRHKKWLIRLSLD